MAWSSSLVALNNYFSKNRGQAVGFSMAGTAVGFMLMPLAVQLLLKEYDFSGAVLILSAVCLNGVVGAMLYQPVEWHMKPILVDEEELKCMIADTNTKVGI